MGSLTGAVSSQRVTEEFKGTLSLVGNQAQSVNVQGCLTARLISRAGTKVGVSDPAVLHGKAVAQQIKGTPGITGLSPLSVHSGEEVWHLNISGCYKSNLIPKIRLITVNPSVKSMTSLFHPAIPWEVYHLIDICLFGIIPTDTVLTTAEMLRNDV